MTRLANSVLILFWILCSGRAEMEEYRVKAAFLFNFAKFVEWPPSQHAPTFNLCVLGRDPFGPALDDAIKGKLVRGVPVLVKRMSSEREAIDTCQMVFIVGNPPRLQEILSTFKTRSVLTVGECPLFAQKGGDIGLLVDRGRIRFDINLSAASDAHLEVSSRLIEIGHVLETPK